jgi:hypothetical protein
MTCVNGNIGLVFRFDRLLSFCCESCLFVRLLALCGLCSNPISFGVNGRSPDVRGCEAWSTTTKLPIGAVDFNCQTVSSGTFHNKQISNFAFVIVRSTAAAVLAAYQCAAHPGTCHSHQTKWDSNPNHTKRTNEQTSTIHNKMNAMEQAQT